jgi:hypothetical protein
MHTRFISPSGVAHLFPCVSAPFVASRSPTCTPLHLRMSCLALRRPFFNQPDPHYCMYVPHAPTNTLRVNRKLEIGIRGGGGGGSSRRGNLHTVPISCFILFFWVFSVHLSAVIINACAIILSELCQKKIDLKYPPFARLLLG